MYTSINFKSKKDLKDAVASGRKVSVYQPNNMTGAPSPTSGTVTVEGPHYPQPHKWYATCTLEDGYIVKVK
jgi:hypothetical protein